MGVVAPPSRAKSPRTTADHPLRWLPLRPAAALQTHPGGGVSTAHESGGGHIGERDSGVQKAAGAPG